jgi:hypothetical protein
VPASAPPQHSRSQASSSVVLGAGAQPAEARLNSVRPATYTRRRPKRSPMLAAVMIPAAKTSR